MKKNPAETIKKETAVCADVAPCVKGQIMRKRHSETF